jgi:hypothetical protein
MFEKRKTAKLAAEQALVREQLEHMIHDVERQVEAETPLVLAPQEWATYAIRGAGLFEPRRGPGHWAGRSTGVSVATGGGTRFRIGATRGHYVQGAETPTTIDTGTVTFTDRRIVFLGARYTREWPFAKLVGIEHFSNRPWTAIQVSNRQRTSGFTYTGLRPEFVRARLEIALGLYQGKRDEILRQLGEQLAELAPPVRDEPADLQPADQQLPPVTPAPAAPPGAPSSSPAAPPAAPIAPPPPTWAPDPSGQHRLRWWDGRQWTNHIAD